MDIENDPVARAWDDFADEFYVRTGDAGDYDYQHFITPAVLRLLGDPKGLRILDQGCGTGIVTRELARRGAQVVGADISSKMLDLAREFEEVTALGIDYRVGDAASMPDLDDESFDAVVSNMALMNIENHTGAVAEARRVLKPGGRFVLSIYHPCFFMPKSGWAHSNPESGQPEEKHHWRVDHYFQRRQFAKSIFHRTLADYLNALMTGGFRLEALEELPGAFAGDRVAQFLVLAARRG